MSAADPVANVLFASEMSTEPSWEAQVPYTTPIAIPDSSNILAELSMLSSAMNTPVPTERSGSASSEETDDGLFRMGPSKKGMRMSAHSKPIKKAGKATKLEQAFTEPMTPPSMSKCGPRTGLKGAVGPPLSPASQSVCTEDCEDVPSMPPTPLPSDACSLPAMSSEQTAKRRALRRAALKRSRSRKVEGVIVSKMEVVVQGEGESSGTSSEPLDKKAARAIRNREAAMKSRVEAKQRMRKLQDENECLNIKVKTLCQENEELTSQLKNLLQHTLGVQVAEGQDVKEVFSAFARMTRSE